MIKRILILFLISIVALFSTYALSGEMIATADRDILEQMANSRGFDISGSDDEVSKLLYDYLGLEEVTVKLEETKDGGDYRLEILGADNLEDRDGCFVLEGNVSISFSYSDQSPKILTSSSVILDNENKMCIPYKYLVLPCDLNLVNNQTLTLNQINANPSRTNTPLSQEGL